MPSNQLPRQTWFELTAAHETENLAKELWQEIETAYTASNRHYHNLNHLAFMLELAKRYEKQLQNSKALYFTIFYHDLVYDPSRQDNEAKSAEIANVRLQKLNNPAATINTVEAAILATKAHEVNTNSDINFLLDFDLAILGTDWKIYQQYAQNIRKEYSLYPDEIYREGRKKVLQHFLAMPRIYKTPLFQTLLEAKAHHNLQAELQSL